MEVHHKLKESCIKKNNRVVFVGTEIKELKALGWTIMVDRFYQIVKYPRVKEVLSYNMYHLSAFEAMPNLIELQIYGEVYYEGLPKIGF